MRISGDKLKTQTYCEIFELGDQIDDEQDAEKAEELRQKAAKLEEALGPEFVALVSSLRGIDPNSQRRSRNQFDIRSARRIVWDGLKDELAYVRLWAHSGHPNTFKRCPPSGQSGNVDTEIPTPISAFFLIVASPHAISGGA